MIVQNAGDEEPKKKERKCSEAEPAKDVCRTKGGMGILGKEPAGSVKRLM